MATIESQGWEGLAVSQAVQGNVTGWTAGSSWQGYGTTVFAGSVSIINTSGSENCSYTGATDGSSGNGQVSLVFQFADASSGNNLQLLCRQTVLPPDAFNLDTTYRAIALGATGVRLDAVVAGSSTTLAGGSPVGDAATLEASVWYYMQLVPNGTTIKVRLQRASDNAWLTSGGTWGNVSASFPDTAATTYCITSTAESPAITGAGYAGFRTNQTSSGSIIIDPFLFESLSASATGIFRAAPMDGMGAAGPFFAQARTYSFPPISAPKRKRRRYALTHTNKDI